MELLIILQLFYNYGIISKTLEVLKKIGADPFRQSNEVLKSLSQEKDVFTTFHKFKTNNTTMEEVSKCENRLI